MNEHEHDDQRLIWRLVIFRISNKAFISGATVFISSMAGFSWSGLSPTAKCLLLLGVIVAMGNTVDAFLDKTISRISAGKPPNGGGGTEFLSKKSLTEPAKQP